MPTKVIQVTNIAPQATKEQLKTLFSYIGHVDDIQLYPDKDSTSLADKICYVKFDGEDDVGVSLHLTNTVFIDRALIVIPVPNGTVPDETTALIIAAGKHGDGDLAAMMLDSTFASTVEDIRRTVYVSGMNPMVTGEQMLQYFMQAGDINYVRMANDLGQPTRSGFIEFTEQAGYSKAIGLSGATFMGNMISICQSNNAIVKPASTTLPQVPNRDIEEALKKVKEAQSLISAHVDPAFRLADNRSRSRSKSRSRRKRSRSHSRRSRSRSRHRSRSRSRRSRSRKRSRSKKRSHSPKRRSRSQSRGSRKRRSRSKSRGRSKRSRSRSRRSPSPSRRRSKSRSKGRSGRKSRSRSRSKNRLSSSDKKSRLSKQKSKANDSSRSRKSRSRSRTRRSSSRGRRKRSRSHSRKSKSPRRRKSKSRSRSPRRSRKDRKRERSRDRGNARRDRKKRDRSQTPPPKEAAKVKRDYDEEEKGFNNSDSDTRPEVVNADNGSDGSDGSSSSESASSSPERGTAIPTLPVTNRSPVQEDEADTSSNSENESNMHSQDMEVDSD